MKKILSLVVSSCICITMQAQQIEGTLQKAINSLVQDDQFKYASYSICVLDGNSGKILFKVNENQALAPASCLKVLTAATALKKLGPRYQYKTRLQYTGHIDSAGTLHGDIIIKGGGDPSLASPRWSSTIEEKLLDKWTAALQGIGIKKVNGRIIGDDSFFDTQTTPDGWIVQDIGNYYGAGPSGLSWRENQFDILLKPTQTGKEVEYIQMKPWIPQLTLVNELTTGANGTGDNAYVYSAPYSNIAYMRGTVGADERNFDISASTPDPALDAAFRLRTALKSGGIDVTGEFTTVRRNQQAIPAEGTTIDITTSPGLDKIIFWFLRKSVNLFGEHLIKTIAYEEHLPVSTKNGVTALRSIWQMEGIDSNSMNIFDGSGLSPANRITTESLAKVMFLAQKEPWFNVFYDALPTINQLKMKDGYINGVRSYTGYATAKNGHKYVFSFIVNNFVGSPGTARQKMWRLLDELK
ncbi:D-alanyl-D-alanine carboxypeptidase/D-alanyl-D-alanine-endopeptidase [Chitinophaga caeni]|uniref:D-alanyl-D-alanine carboxypeptidase/D-alanyl-D-alanine-endopeptidase n=1 Tax=Chitinophaga caeni TaxID=2029983 RepID=A0A291QVN5_9BACT|nr:D-alanyl-D-alanine carboxypeptidase/D-alanyl-D-alanine-endopeptidase [Chitinophaga caeni]ATL47981.1 D-alanyl-D-alanine carboxypeptidase/D-alanyl-D-alanine-endopeptidase [Chitinophaga caeni]